MKSNQNSTNNFHDEVNKSNKFINNENLDYLYPNGHRNTPQMKWFKGRADRGLKSDIAA